MSSRVFAIGKSSASRTKYIAPSEKLNAQCGRLITLINRQEFVPTFRVAEYVCGFNRALFGKGFRRWAKVGDTALNEFPQLPEAIQLTQQVAEKFLRNATTPAEKAWGEHFLANTSARLEMISIMFDKDIDLDDRVEQIVGMMEQSTEACLAK